MRARLLRLYRLMFQALGPQHWWPARTPFEVVVGAMLTQNTAWTNVEKAMAALRAANALRPAALAALPRARLARLIRAAGYYNIKAKRLQNLRIAPAIILLSRGSSRHLPCNPPHHQPTGGLPA